LRNRVDVHMVRHQAEGPDAHLCIGQIVSQQPNVGQPIAIDLESRLAIHAPLGHVAGHLRDNGRWPTFRGQRKCRRWPRFVERSGANLGPFFGHARNRRAGLKLLCRHSDFSCPPSTATRSPRRNLRLWRSSGSCSTSSPPGAHRPRFTGFRSMYRSFSTNSA
jgi:hypothetical protein